MSGLPASIRAAFEEAGGRLTFARFMELALTEPQSGYYTASERRVGPEGDFTTAPRRVPEFSRALARLLAGLADSLSEAGWRDRLVLVEVGPGEGDLAYGVLNSWEAERPDLKERVACRLIEVGEGLRARQWERLAELALQGWDIDWCGELNRALGPAALVVSNELVDALPVHRLRVRGPALEEAWVVLQGVGGRAQPAEEWAELSPAAVEELERLFGTSDPVALRRITRDGEIELRPAVVQYLRGVSAAFRAVCLVTIDYGDWLSGLPGPEDEGLCPPKASAGDQERPPTPPLHGRSLRTYYRHQRGQNPYQAVGRQDITADVDFRALALHGREQGLDCLVFTPLARLLRGLGDPEAASLSGYSLDTDLDQAPLRALLDEDGLGGLFKVMVQVKEEGAPST